MGVVVSWYYCLVHQKVEPQDGCANAERLGPYATEQEAEHALQGVEGIAFQRFSQVDIIRHPVVGRIVEAYERYRG